MILAQNELQPQVEIDEISEVGTLYRNQLFHRKVKGSKKGKEGKKRKKAQSFCVFCPLCLFCFHGFIDTTARLEKVSRHQMKTAIVADRIQQDVSILNASKRMFLQNGATKPKQSRVIPLSVQGGGEGERTAVTQKKFGLAVIWRQVQPLPLERFKIFGIRHSSLPRKSPVNHWALTDLTTGNGECIGH